MRIVFWNIRAGGGVRVPAIGRRLGRWAPDLVALCEYRGSEPSARLAAALREMGLPHQRTTVDPRRPTVNRLLVASRWPLVDLGGRYGPAPAGRWLLSGVAAPAPFALGAMHIPNRVEGTKDRFQAGVLRLLRDWRHGPGLLLGDTNSGLPGIDEEAPAFGPREARWMAALDRLGWADAFRRLHGGARAYTWYSPNGANGFRIDHAFANRDLSARVVTMRYDWGGPPGRRRGPSDHAAIVLDLEG